MDEAAKQRGRDAEERAVRHLAALGFEILARNLRTRTGEVDVAAREGPTFVIVEVRYRHEHFGGGWRSLGSRKRRALIRAAREARGMLRIPRSVPIRLDVVLIASGDRLLHLRGALSTSVPYGR